VQNLPPDETKSGKSWLAESKVTDSAAVFYELISFIFNALLKISPNLIALA
jgi:hypothetical protein